MTTDQQKPTVGFDYNVFRAAEKRFAEIVEIEESEAKGLYKYKVYHISLTLKGLPPSVLPEHNRHEKLVVSRRYSDFERFHSLIRDNHRGVLLPCLPSKALLSKISPLDQTALLNRADALELYLNKVLTNEALAQFDEFQAFFSPVGSPGSGHLPGHRPQAEQLRHAAAQVKFEIGEPAARLVPLARQKVS